MQRIQVSENQRFLVTENGEPFFWLADAAWEMVHRLTREEIDHYLDNRAMLGFTVIQTVALAEFDGLTTPNAYGALPLHDLNPRQPNEAYFAHVDYARQAAETRGMYLALLPTWGDKVTKAWGAGPVIFTTDNLDDARAYGEWLAQRYRNAPNLVWVLGGDRPPMKDDQDYRPIWRAMADGIRAVSGKGALITYHTWGHPDGTAALHDEAWLDFHMLQSGHVLRDTPNWESLTKLRALTPPKPVLDSEPNYEDHSIDPWLRQWQPSYGVYNEYDVRKQAYRAVFAGAFGHTYGHHAIWQFYAEGRQSVGNLYCAWQQALHRPGAAQMQRLKHIMLARPFLTRIPDQSIILSDAGTRGTHIRATRDTGGTYAFVYIPQSGTHVEISLGWLAGGEGAASWYDPRSGVCIDLGRVNGASAHFTTLDHGPDWVLVIDAVAAGYAPLGAFGVMTEFGEYR
jgi:Protein of unknown function (DUF4038)/Putative collagen-binding domain of a collagenase